MWKPAVPEEGIVTVYTRSYQWNLRFLLLLVCRLRRIITKMFSPLHGHTGPNCLRTVYIVLRGRGPQSRLVFLPESQTRSLFDFTKFAFRSAADRTIIRHIIYRQIAADAAHKESSLRQIIAGFDGLQRFHIKTMMDLLNA